MIYILIYVDDSEFDDDDDNDYSKYQILLIYLRVTLLLFFHTSAR